MNERMKMGERCKFSRWKWDCATQHLKRAELCRKLLYHHLQSRMTWVRRAKRKEHHWRTNSRLACRAKTWERWDPALPTQQSKVQVPTLPLIRYVVLDQMPHPSTAQSPCTMMWRFCPRAIRMVEQNTCGGHFEKCELLTVGMWWNCVVNDWFLFSLPNSICFPHPR